MIDLSESTLSAIVANFLKHINNFVQYGKLRFTFHQFLLKLKLWSKMIKQILIIAILTIIANVFANLEFSDCGELFSLEISICPRNTLICSIGSPTQVLAFRIRGCNAIPCSFIRGSEYYVEMEVIPGTLIHFILTHTQWIFQYSDIVNIGHCIGYLINEKTYFETKAGLVFPKHWIYSFRNTRRLKWSLARQSLSTCGHS